MKLDDFAIVGAGSLASALCRSMIQLGFRLDQVVVRNPEAGLRFVQEMGSGRSVSLADWNGTEASLLILCVPDDSLEPVAGELALQGTWDGKTVLHTSGVHNRNVLYALASQGAYTGSFHPLQTFVGQEDATSFHGITIGIEGDEGALETAKHLADDLLATAIDVPSSRKSLYHAAASLAGNAAITLMSISEELWENAAGTREGFSLAMGPLIRTSLENALEMHPEQALTGPIVRGDSGTLQAHLASILESVPHLLVPYCAFAAETVHLAVRSGRLSADQAVALLDVIDDHIAGNASSEG